MHTLQYGTKSASVSIMMIENGGWFLTGRRFRVGSIGGSKVIYVRCGEGMVGSFHILLVWLLQTVACSCYDL